MVATTNEAPRTAIALIIAVMDDDTEAQSVLLAADDDPGLPGRVAVALATYLVNCIVVDPVEFRAEMAGWTRKLAAGESSQD